MIFTYNELSRILSFSHSAISRYAVYVLGIDRQSPKAGGVKRLINLDGAIKIYIISRLIGILRMESQKAIEIMMKIKTTEDIWSIKLEEGIYVNFVIDDIRTNLINKRAS